MNHQSTQTFHLKSIFNSVSIQSLCIQPKFYLIFVFFSFFATQASGQLFHENLLNSDRRLTFLEIVEETESHYDKISREKGNGYKQFQRWKYWAQRNLDENGRVRNDMQALKEYFRFRNQRQGNQRTFDGSYVELGPQSSVITSSWSSGLGRVSAIGLDANNASHIIVGSPTGGIWRTTNLGTNWTPVFDDQALIDVYSLEISRVNPNHYWAGLNDKVVRSVNGGNSWTDVNGTTQGLYSTIEMHPTDDNIIFAINQSWGIVFRSTNGGNDFVAVLDHTSGMHDLEFHPTDPMTIYASGNGAMFISTDGGLNFNQVTSGLWPGLISNTMMLAVTPAAPSNIYALEETRGGLNAVYLSRDEGANWEILTDNSCNCQNMLGWDITRIGGQAPRDMDIVVSPINQNIIHIAGIDAWRTQDMGANWTQTTFWDRPNQSNFIHADIDLLIYDNNRIVAGTDGGIYFSTDEATTWTDISQGLGIRQFYRIGASETDPDRVSGGSQDNGTGILRSNTWFDWLGADGMETFIDWSDENILYGSTQNGKLYKSIDGGQTRIFLNQPDSTGSWVTPFEQDPINSNTIYTAREDVLRSTNGGTTWTSLMTASTKADEMKIAPTNNNYIYVSYGRRLFRTTDGGANWTTTILPSSWVNYIAVNPYDPEVLSIVMSGDSSKIIESRDAGATFTDLTSDFPSGITPQCVTYEQRANGGLFVGGNPGVFYSSSTDDPVWEDNSNNLPMVRISELEIRNGVMYVATYGRGLWKFDLDYDEDQNEVAMINPPTSVAVNEQVNIAVNYKNNESTDAYVLVRFKSPTGDNLGQDFVQVSPGQGTVNLTVPAPAIADTGYSYQAQLLRVVTWAGLAEDVIENVTVGTSSGGSNAITLINPPTTVSADELVDVTVNYNNTEAIDAYVLVRFKSPTGDNLGQDFAQVSPGSGTMTLQVTAPSNAGGGYRYQAQLLLTGTWAGLAEDNISDVTVGASETNAITLIDPPTTVTTNELVDVTVTYRNTESIDAYVLARFKSPAGDNLEQDFILVPPGQGIVNLQFLAPANAGSGYSYQAQLLLSGTWAGLAEDNINDVLVDSGNSSNSILLVNPPTSVDANELVNVTVNYSNIESVDAYVLARFRSPSGENLGQDYKQVSPGQGTETLQVPAPLHAGSGYSYQAQLLRTVTWAGLAEDIVNNVEITGGNSTGELVTLESWPDTIELGGSYNITVNYDVSQNSVIYTQIFDRETTDATGSWNKIGEGWVFVEPGTGSANIDNIFIDLDVGTSNRLEVLLFQPEGGTWGDPLPIGNVAANVPGKSGIVFGLVDASDPITNMRYYNQDLECNGNTYNGNSVGNGSGFDHTLAPTTNIYRSNWWVNANWKGPIKSHYGENSENGKNFWVEWQNLGTCSDGHAEFDIRVEKSNVSDFAIEAGFPSRLGDIIDPLDCTFTGKWTAGSQGRGHINMTAWVYNTLDLIPNANATRCDIIVHAWDNSGDFRKKYEIGFRWSWPGTNIIFHFDKIGTATANGITYDVLRTMPGGFGEGASYNLIPSSWPREFATEFPTSNINSSIDMNKILKDIIVLEAANGPDVVNNQDGSSYIANLLTEDWGLHVMEWTVTGQSGEYEHDPAFPDDFDKKIFIPNSMGRFTFDEYFIPNPCCSNPSLDCPSFIICPDPIDCESSVVQTGNVIISESQAAHNSIISDGIVMNGSVINFAAGNTIELIERFEVNAGAVFHAYIEACGN